MAEALERLLRAPDEQKVEAARAFLEAEDRHLATIGRKPALKGKTALLAPLVLVSLLTLILVFVLALSISTHSTTETVAANTRALVRQHRENVYSNREQCERNNDARVASVAEKRADIRYTLRPSLRLWESVVHTQGIDPSTPPQVVAAFNDFLDKLHEGIASKRKGIHESISSQAAVAVHKGSPRADCVKAFPLGEGEGD